MVAAVALFAAASCNKELPQEDLPAVGETVVYTASTDGADTKAVLNEDTKKSEWVADDAITVHDGEKGWTFTAAEAGANVDFSNSEGFGEYRPVFAVYPAGTYTVDFEAKTVNANIPTYQSVMAGTYDDKAALAVAYSENDKFAFKNAHALIKFTVKSPNIKAIEFYGNNGEAITGNMLVSLNEKNTISSVVGQDTVFEEGKDNEWTGKGTWVKCSSADENNNWCFTNGETYYAVIAPASFDEGVSLNIFLNDGSYEGKKIEKVKTTTSGLILKANTILNIGDVEYVAPATVEKVYLQPGVWSADNAWFSAHFFNSVGGAEDVKMTDEDTDGVYEVSVPAGMESVIFCRMNPEYTEFGWDVWEGETEVENHVWNQTGDLVLPLAGDTKVYYNVTDWEAGEWSDTPQESTPEEPTEITVYFRPSNDLASSVSFAAWCWGTGEGAWHPMSDLDGDGIYELTVSNSLVNIIFTAMNSTNPDWNNKVYQTGDLKLPADDNCCFLAATDTWVTLAEAKEYVEPTPEPEQVRIYVNKVWGWNFGLWCWDANGKQIIEGTTWPGVKYQGTETVSGTTYVYWNVPETYVNQTVSLLITNINGTEAKEQSADYTNLTLSESVYFDLEWTQELGVHLIKK